MLVDDNKLDNFFHQRVLSKCCPDLTIVSFTCPRVAMTHLLEGAATWQPGLVFLDINMPEMTGWEFLDEFCRVKPEAGIKFVMMSGQIPDSNRIDDFKDFITSFAHKPLTVPYVYDLLFNKCSLSTDI